MSVVIETSNLRKTYGKHEAVKALDLTVQGAGFGKIGWHTFRHSLSAWGKEALKLEETKELLRHSNVQTTSDIYGGLSLEAKRAAQGRLVKFVHRASRGERKSTVNSD